MVLPVGAASAMRLATSSADIAVFDVPNSSAITPPAPDKLTIQLQHDRLPAGFGTVYVGPRALIDREVATLRARQGLIDKAMPVAVLLCFLTSVGLIFFSHHPARYVFLIGAFTCSILIELESKISLSTIPLRDLESYLGTFLVAFSTLNLQEWWVRPKIESRVIWSLMLLTLVMLALTDNFYGIGNDRTGLFRKAIFLTSLAGMTAYWLVLVRQMDALVDEKAKVVASFCGAIVFAFILNTIRLYIPTGAHAAFALSSAAKILGALSIFGLSVSALFYEIQEYAVRRRQLGAMQRIASGANLNIDSEARQLKEEIEQRTLLEERQRLVRDMHDGIGGQLLGVLIKLRREEAPREELARDVQATIAELRLLTAAMDSQMPGLRRAMATRRPSQGLPRRLCCRSKA